MIWSWVKGNHRLAIQPWVRWWLRMGRLGRFIVVLIIYLAFMALSAPFAAVIFYLRYRLPEDLQFLLFIPILINFVRQLAMFTLWVLWIVDSYMERKITRADIKRMMSSADVVLATRGEYIGGHPQLPHGRFVYLTMGGTLENPLLSIVLPRAGGSPDEPFAMPILDLQKTTQSIAKTGDETTVSLTLASVTFRAKFLGEQATLNVEYIGQAGRKHVVEITRFLFGNGEIQTWHNYVICIQAEADTGKPPYGPWKSLPRGAPPVRDTAAVHPPVGAVSGEPNAPPRTPPADNPPPGELPTAHLPPGGWKKLT